ncbi:MAG: hypothetical protein HEP71_10230 [Roseivirga sp.]|nr:hypothetical protein [Roseivirga sp.]
MKKYLCPIFLLVLLWSCTDNGPGFPEGDVVGYRPVYAVDIDLTISIGGSREIVNTGKIFRQGDILLLNEVNEGIHFINNTDPTNPVNLGFLTIKGSTDMSVRDDVLYVNQYSDIVALDFSDLQNIREINRQRNAFEVASSAQLTPPERGYYFECVDASKGEVVDWQLTTITNPKCYR